MKKLEFARYNEDGEDGGCDFFSKKEFEQYLRGGACPKDMFFRLIPIVPTVKFDITINDAPKSKT